MSVLFLSSDHLEGNHPFASYPLSLLLSTGEGEFDNTYADVAQYGTTLFWDERYVADPEPFEWYYGYEYFHNIIEEALSKKDANIMM